MNGSESALLWVSLVGIAAAGFLGGYLAALMRERYDWLPMVEAAAARPVHVMVEHTGPLTPAGRPEPSRPDQSDQAEDDDIKTADPRKRVPTPTFYG